MLYYKYSDYLKNKYGEKVYKLPVNLPVTCPNRLDGDGCAFCAGAGTGFEAMSAAVSVTEQTDDHEKIPCQQIYCIFSELYQYLSSSG